MSTLKRVLLIILLLLVAALIGYGLYYMFTRVGAPAKLPTAPQLPGATGTLPGAGMRPPTTAAEVGQPVGVLPPGGVIQPGAPSYFKPAAVSQISTDYATNPSLNSGGAYRYYNASDGKFYRIGADGKIAALSDQVFYNASNVTWAAKKDVAVIQYPDDSKIIYNFETQKQVSLPKHWSDFSFSPDGEQVAAKSIGLAPENRWLATIKTDGTGERNIEPMGDYSDEVTVDWSPSGQVAAFSQTGQPLGAERREELLIGLNGENFKSITVEGLGFEPQWSTTGKKLLYSVYSANSDYKPELWIVNAYGDQIGSDRKTVKLNTWADKCTFADDNTVFCAVPKDLPEGAGMSREVANDTTDDLYKVDLKTGLKTPVALNGDYNITNISYDAAKNRVLFTDLNQTGVFEAKL